MVGDVTYSYEILQTYIIYYPKVILVYYIM